MYRVILLTLALASTCIAEEQDLPPTEPVFNVLGVDQGLPSATISAMVEDRFGRIWVGTNNGLARIDGHQLRIYVADPADPHALVSNAIDALAIDAEGRVWAATQGGHVARYSFAEDRFQRIEWGRADTPVFALLPIGNDMLLGTIGRGLLRLDSMGTVHEVDARIANITDLHGDLGSVWVRSLDNALWRLVDGRLQRVAGPPERNVYSVYVRDGVAHFTTRDGDYCTAQLDGAVSCTAVPEIARPGRLRMVLPMDNEVWLGGDGELLRWSMPNAQAQRIAFRPGAIGGIQKQQFWAGHVDRTGGIWLSTGGGGLLHWPLSARRFSVWAPDVAQGSEYNDGRVRGISRRSGELLLGTMSSGLIRVDSAGRARALPVDGVDVRVWAVHANNNTLWIGHNRGLVRIEGDRTSPLLTDVNVDLLAQFGSEIWAAQTGRGAARIDATGQVTTFAFAANGFFGIEVQQIAAGADSVPWLATDAGLFRFDAERSAFDQMVSGSVDAFSIGRRGVHLFVDGELRRYRWHDGLYRDETFAPRKFPKVQTIGALHDDGTALWLMGPQGLYRWDDASDTIASFDRRDGLPTRELSDRPAFVDSNGVFVGSEHGVLHFDPAKFRSAPAPSSLRIDSIRVAAADGDTTTRGSNAIRVAADHQALTIDARLDTLDRAHDQRFAFRLLPRDTEWPGPQASPTLNLGYLAPGTYTLRVRALDGFGQAARNEVALSITVDSPGWRWWAMLSSAAILGCAFWFYAAWLRRRERARSALQEAHRRLDWAQALAAEKSALVAELSHEIRNPLNSMLGMARLLATAALPAASARHVALLNSAGSQLVSLLDNVLDWSRIEADAESLTVEAVDISDELGAQVEHYRHDANAKGLIFECAIEPGLAARASAPRLRQIIDNLLSNAVKYTAKGSVRLCAVRDGEEVSISVIDTGPGLSDEQLNKLFRPFARGAGERLAPGTGLGLVLSKRLAERMAGSLTVVPKSDGACFQLRLPAAPPTFRAQRKNPLPEDGSLAGLRVLLVEDDAIAREATEAELRRLGADVLSAADALAALVQLSANSVDVVLIDWDLPGMSGLDLALIVGGRYPSLRLIALTARATPDDVALASERGFAAHVAKPVDLIRLVRAIRGES